jgi:hypothetical protein
VARRARLERRPLQRHPQLGELPQPLALELGGAAQGVVGILDPARLAQRLGDRRQDEAPRVRHLVSQPDQSALRGVLRLVEPPERGQRLNLGANGDAEDVRIRRALGGQRVDRAARVGQRLLGAPGQQPDVGPRGLQDAERERVGRELLHDREAQAEMMLGRLDIALLVMPAREVVA